MSDFVTTATGDRVAYDRRGSGPALIFVPGAGPWRAIDPTTTETAELLVQQGVTTIVYDRVGRGESFAPGAIELDREVAAIAALIDAVGGGAVLCGHSSGCSISLYAAAAARLPVTGLALWEAPLAPPGSGAREWAETVSRHIDAGELESALRHYMRDMPPEILEFVLNTPAMVDQAGSLKADADSLVWAESAPHAKLFGGIAVPTVALIGAETYDIMRPAAESIAAAVPGATWREVPGAQHSWQPKAMADELAALVAAAGS